MQLTENRRDQAGIDLEANQFLRPRPADPHQLRDLRDGSESSARLQGGGLGFDTHRMLALELAQTSS